jgi:sensor histidine kinase regulating citrate/malate metabolism
MKRLGRLSLRVRLTLLFLLLTSAAWGIASLVAWQQTTDKLDKLFDTQQLLFARRLSAMNLTSSIPSRHRCPTEAVKHHLSMPVNFAYATTARASAPRP